MAKTETPTLPEDDWSAFSRILWDSDFKVLEWNKAAEEIFGYTKEEALGQAGADLIVSAVRPTAVVNKPY